MFRERMLHWAKLMDSFTCTMNTAMVLAKRRVNAFLFANTPQRPVPMHRATADPTLDMALAYVQISRLNR